MCARWLVLIAVLSALAISGTSLQIAHAAPGDTAAAANAESVEARDVFDRSYVCGPNCLYAFLKLQGKDVDYELLRASLTVESRGTNLLELKKAALRIGGVSTELRRCGLDHLRDCNKPCIAHFKRPPYPEARSGHFVVVVATERSQVRVIDGLDAHVWNYPEEKFAKLWSGNILEPAASRGPSNAQVFCLLATPWILFWLISRSNRSRRLRKAAPLAAGVAILCAIGAAAAQDRPQPQSAATSTDAAEALPADDILEPVRAPQNDGLNSLYLMLRLFQQPVEYGKLRMTLAPGRGGNNLVELREAAAACGLKSQVVKGSPDDLRRGPFPMIAAFDDPGENSRRFVLVIGFTEGRCTMVEGGFCMLRQLSIDDFRRNWSGYVLVARPSERLPAYVSLGLGFGALAAYLAWRVRANQLPAVTDQGAWPATSDRGHGVNLDSGPDQEQPANS